MSMCLIHFNIIFLKDKSYKDIMRETGLSLNEIKTHIQNGKLNLKKTMLKWIKHIETENT